jgi:deazaflavin-dependent oxidoreductase (nitroreductase family)
MSSPPPAGEEKSREQDPTRSLVVRLVTNPVSTWLIRNISARIDPILYKATNGRLHSMGPGTETMVTLTTRGARSGRPRSAHLACVHHEGDILLVASAMGQQKHPGWRYNLEANPECEVQTKGQSYRARARVLTDEEKEAVWDKMRRQIPMIHVYEQRTDRNIRVFRLTRIDEE